MSVRRLHAGRGPADRVRAVEPSDAWLIVAVLALIGFLTLTMAVASKVVFPFDAPLLALARSWDGWPLFWNAVSQSANVPLIVLLCAFVVWLWWQKLHREAVLVVVILIAITAGSEGIKEFTGRVRPSGSGDGIPGVIYSYPSGHVLEVLTILGMIVQRIWRRAHSRALRLILVILAGIEVGLVAISRLALDEHFPSDVLAGALGATVALSLYAWFTRTGGWADKPAADKSAGGAARAHDATDTRA